MNIKNHIAGLLRRSIGEQFDKYDEVVISTSDKEGVDFQYNGAFKLAKEVGTSPEKIVEILCANFPTEVASTSLGGKGFMNFSVSQDYLNKTISWLANDKRLGFREGVPGFRIIMDFGGPNVAKALHVGHLRSAIIGDTLARIFRFAGCEVITDCHLGDWGFQMGLLIVAIQDLYPDLPYFDSTFAGEYPQTSPVTLADLEALYPIASKKAETDEAFRSRAQEATTILQTPSDRNGYKELWKHIVSVSVAQIKIDFERLDVSFNLWNGESHVNDMIPAMITELEPFTKEDDGAIIMPLDDLPPLIVKSKAGAALYGTTDLATIKQRSEEYKPSVMFYCVDYRQATHFEQVFAAAYKAEFTYASLEHLKNGTVNGQDGKPFKTRTGGTAKLVDLIDMARDAARDALSQSESAKKLSEDSFEKAVDAISLAALRFGELINKRTESYVFDTDRFGFEGKTGPYIIYQCVRIKSALSKTTEQPGYIDIGDDEREIAILIDGFQEAIQQTMVNRMPHYLATHAYELASAFSRYYGKVSILHEADDDKRRSRLALLSLVYSTLELELELLGIKIPDAM
jgi:arginyl-tRNA synthetase